MLEDKTKSELVGCLSLYTASHKHKHKDLSLISSDHIFVGVIAHTCNINFLGG